QPHPPVWVAASRSDDTYRWAGANGFHLMTLPFLYEPPVLRYEIEAYKEELAKAGYDPATRRVLGRFPVYVADSVESARRDAAGYLEKDIQVIQARNPGGSHLSGWGTFEEQVERRTIVAGDPQRCIDILK